MITDDVCSLPAVSTNHIFWYIHVCYTCVSTYHIFSLVNICTYVHTRFCPQHDCWWCLFTTRRFHKSHLLIHTHAFPQIISSLGSFIWLTVNFLLRRVTRVLWGVSHMTQQCLYLQCSLVDICLCSSFETSLIQIFCLGIPLSPVEDRRRFLQGTFSLGKRNDIRQGLASSHVNSQWLVNPRGIVPEKTQWKWTRGMWQDSCDTPFLWKRQGMWKWSAASHLNLQSHWTQDVFYLRKHTESGRVPATHVLVEKRYGIRERWVAGHMNLQSQGTQDAFYLKKGIWGGLVERAFFTEKHTSQRAWAIRGIYIYIYNQNEGQAHSTRENTKISPGLAGVAYKFTVKMKARCILHEKTQWFLRGRRELHINLQGKESRGAFYTRKHNDFSGVGCGGGGGVY